jgi:peptide methionine sulfoxide reductase MsrB
MNRLVILGLLIAASAANIPLVTWDGASGTTFDFKELNDPVMGGQSYGTFSVDKSGHYGIFDGEVKDVPSLKAPGFIKTAGDGQFQDASSALDGDLVLSVRSTTPEYTGFRVSFAAGTVAPSYSCAGGGSIPFSRGCFKANFKVPSGSDFSEVRVPFKQFSDMWSPATGEHTKDCANDSEVCPTASSLKGIKRIEVWAEGALGKIHLELQSISAVPSSSSSSVLEFTDATRPPAQFDMCSTPVQSDLRFNISTRMDSFGGESANESLAESVCCDSRNKILAEPQFLFEAPDVQMFAELEKTTGVTTFYDSVCGVPLFRAPVNRTFDAFQQDTTEHGWPSFRPAEVVTENIQTDRSTGMVTSSCGTHLGSFLPDDKGDRWCIDLSCISGHSAH